MTAITIDQLVPIIQEWTVNKCDIEKIYNNLTNNGWAREAVDNFLARPLIWKTNQYGMIHIRYYSSIGPHISKYYQPQQISNGLLLLGAICTFYNESIAKVNKYRKKNPFAFNPNFPNTTMAGDHVYLENISSPQNPLNPIEGYTLHLGS